MYPFLIIQKKFHITGQDFSKTMRKYNTVVDIVNETKESDCIDGNDSIRAFLEIF
jgi:hypothetical protein